MSGASAARRPRLGGWLAVTIVLAAALGGAVWAFWPAPGGRADAGDARLVALGSAVYAKHCASCHGAKLEGQPNWRGRNANGRLPAPPHDESGHTWHHADEQLFRITKFGLKPPVAPKGYESDMPAFAGVLTDREIWAVLAYIKRRWPPHIRERQRRRDAAYRR